MMNRLVAVIGLWSVTSLVFHDGPKLLVTGLPSGASQCPGGVAAVGGSHLSRPEMITGSLMNSSAQLQVLLDGQPLSTSSPTNVTVGADHTLELVGASPFRGFLFRLGGGPDIDTTESLIVAQADFPPTVQLAEAVCIDGEGVGGLTHANNVDKTSAKGILRIDQAATNLPLDKPRR